MTHSILATEVSSLPLMATGLCFIGAAFAARRICSLGKGRERKRVTQKFRFRTRIRQPASLTSGERQKARAASA
jgi:hypothetical protein